MNKGFTLLEVVVSLVIMSMITVMVYSSFAGAVNLREAAEVDEETVHGGRVALQRLSRELQMTFIDPRVYAATSGQIKGGSFIEAFKTMFKGEDTKPIDTLTFTSFSHLRLYRGTREGDQTELTWWGEPDEDNPGLYKLMHREAPRIDAEPDKGGAEEVLARGVKEFNLRFYDFRKEEWVEEWDSEGSDYKARVPKAVEIGLVLVDPDGVVHPYRTKVYLEIWKQLPPTLGDSSRATSGAGGGTNGGNNGGAGANPQGLIQNLQSGGGGGAGGIGANPTGVVRP